MTEIVLGLIDEGNSREGRGGPVTVEGDTFRQNTFSNICLYMDSAHKTTQGIFNFHFCLFVKWANVYAYNAYLSRY